MEMEPTLRLEPELGSPSGKGTPWLENTTLESPTGPVQTPGRPSLGRLSPESGVGREASGPFVREGWNPFLSVSPVDVGGPWVLQLRVSLSGDAEGPPLG